MGGCARDDEMTDFAFMVREIERHLDGPTPREGVLGVLAAQAGRVMRFSRYVVLTPRQVELARRMLDRSWPMEQVRGALQAECGCSRRTAYRLIAAAIAQRGKERAAEMARSQGDFFA